MSRSSFLPACRTGLGRLLSGLALAATAFSAQGANDVQAMATDAKVFHSPTVRAVQLDEPITLQASATYEDGGRTVTLLSNIVKAHLDDSPPTITFYTDATYSRAAKATHLGRTLFIGINATSCNQHYGKNETLTVDIWSVKLQRTLSTTAIEVTSDSGEFRFQVATGADTANWKSTEQPQSGGMPWVPASTNDVLEAHIDGCGYGEATSRILIDPSGMVFDSASNAPVPGAVVTIIDVTGGGNGGLAGKPAKVFADDGVTPWPSTIKTGADGSYTFPVVAPSQYRIDVVTPPGYQYPSTHAPATLPAGHQIHLTGSFHGQFEVNPVIGDLLIDLPLDEIPHGMSVTKTASRATAEIAESVGYTVVVRNVGNTDLDHVDLTDTLPTGFAYLRASTTIDGQPAGEPTGGRGPVLNFQVPAMPAGQTRTLRYRATIGALALQGDGVNRAQARASLPFATVSNVAAAAVQVQQGVFTDKAMVLGKVYADCNANGLQDAGEPGVPGVRLIMEDGSFVVTDGNGQYNFYGIAPRTHVLKIDATTLPAGTAPTATSSRNAGDGASRFVDPHRGELHRADFALSGCSAALDTVIKLRSNAANEISAALKMDFRADGGLQAAGDVRAQPATGIVGQANGADGTRYVTIKAGADRLGAAGAMQSALAEPAPAPAAPTLADAMQPLDNSVGFIGLQDGQTLPAAQATVRVKGSSQTQLSLAVDGKEIGAERIGTRVQDDAREIQARDYVGVPLAPGDHVFTLTAKDQFGNVRGTSTVKLRAPGNLARVILGLPATSIQADGQALVPVGVDLADAQGVAVGARTAVTLDATLGDWDVRDLDPREAGIQTFIEGGHADFNLRAPGVAGTADLRVSAGAVVAKGSIGFVPALRPMIAAGIVEGALNLRKLDPKSIVPARSDDGFEAQLNQFASSGANSANGRAALFLKGKVLGSSLLTIGYDSGKDASQGLFRDIQPDQFYPVYGDSSTKGFDAQSTSRLYVRVEHDKSWILYGDFTTQTADPTRQLGAYQRSLTGAKGHLEQGPVSATAFASQTASRQIVDEIKANGTSGPFMLSSNQPVENSEKVQIVVRDRNQPALVLRTTDLVRFSDYDLDTLTGRLLLRAPVPSFDPELNPESIRVTYEAATGGPSFLVAGADAKVKVGGNVELGMSLVMDQDPLDSMKMGSVSATYKPDDKTSVTVEAARTDHDLGGTGNAQRIELKHDGDRLKVIAQAAHTDATFDNPSSLITQGRSEADLKASYALDDKTRLVVEAAHTGDVVTGDRRDGMLAGVERSLDSGAKLEVGARQVRATSGNDPTVAATPDAVTNATTVRAKISAPVPGVPRATGFVEGEQDVKNADKHLLAVGGDYRLTASSRLYARQEIISSLTGPLSLDASQRRNTTLLGIDSDVATDTHLFSEYRVRDALDGREAEAAMGLRNQYQVAEGLRLNTSFERVRALAGANTDDNTAVTAAVEWTRDPLTKATGRIELRDGGGSSGVLSTLGFARKIDEDWTLLARNAYALTRAVGADQLQERFQIGAAYRDSRTGRVNGLARYEFKRENGGIDFERRTVNLVSSHADWQVARNLIVTGEYAAKHALEFIEGRYVAGNAQLASVRATRDIGERWDAGVAFRVLGDATFSSRATSIGAEIGYRAIENLWVSLGYNITGFRERDLTDDTTTQLGAYLRLRFKFDESLFAAKVDAGSTRVAP